MTETKTSKTGRVLPFLPGNILSVKALLFSYRYLA